MPIIRTGHTGFGEAGDRLLRGFMSGAQLAALRQKAEREEEAFQADLDLADAQTKLAQERARVEG
ncbi:MAG: hypothetical protein JSV86_07625, partial [Gemmatimonadota bacterium]